MRATLLREPLEADTAPATAALLLRGEERPFALIGAWAGGGALLGSRPVRVATPGEDRFALLDEQPEVDGGPAGAVGPAVGGGWVGFLGFELRHAVERGHPPPPRPIAVPDGDLAFYDHVLRRDADGRWWFEALVTPQREAALVARRDDLAARLAAPPAPRPFSTAEWRWTPSPAGHARSVDACVERIAAGDLFQANLCLRLDGRLTGDALDLFATAAAALPTDRAAFVAGPWGTVASLSPELFLARRGRTVHSAPIKGTRPAGGRAELETSVKDRAENVMIVDLVRNDLGRVCVPGGVRVPALAEVRPHAGVWHMVSEVEGELREGVGDGDLLRATFPPGSVTGAPKLAALDVIAELESTGREAYTGAIGFASPLAGLELSVAIRTFEVRGPRIWLGAGGGITADSVGEEEAREAAAKAAPLLAAIGTDPPPGTEGLAPCPPAPGTEGLAPCPRALEPASGAGSSALGTTGGTEGLAPCPPGVARRGPRPVPRPDPAAGLYETVRVADGVAEHLGDHLARLARSMRALYGLALPDALAERAQAAASGHALARLRIDVIPGEEAELAASPLGAIAPAVLRPVVLPGGLGAHKWRDRTLLASHEADDPASLPLLLDADGLVLETSRTSIVVRAADGTLHTPPADGRILPGVTAARAGAAPRALTLADLDAAAEVYVASALRGLSPAARTRAV
ncbi:MAG TPA: aminodeoxychorismate synthase component I [Solirubrobacteraceae bacterium]|nr:aminodeoxychorismate synthase component I [Solirubrobacteraceae bacterium]